MKPVARRQSPWPRTSLDLGRLTGRLARLLGGALLLALPVLLFNALTLWATAARPYTVDAGTYGDQLLLKGFYAQESNASGATYRWTGGSSEVVFDGAALTPQVRLLLEVGGLPAGAPSPLPVALAVNGAPWGTLAVGHAPRRYALLLPATPGADLGVGLASPVTSVGDDPRGLGLRLDAAHLFLGQGPRMPLLTHLAAQLTCLLLVAATLSLLGLSLRAHVTALLALALALALVEALALPLMGLYLPRLVGLSASLALVALLAPPLARRYLLWLDSRDLRWLLGIALVAAALRMTAMLYPPFATHDLPLNLKRLDAVARGVLVLIAPSAEFAGEMTIYPPAPYIALLPTYLLTESRPLTLMFGLALLDGTAAFFVGLLALKLGAGSLAARIAAALYAVSSLAFTALWWGFTAQVFGQWFTTPLALLLIAAAERPRPRTWVAACFVFQVALLTHAGVAVLDVVWVTLSLLLLMLDGRVSAGWWKGALLFYVASGLMAFVLLYWDVFFFMLGETADAGQTIAEGELFPKSGELFLKGMLLAYTPVGLLLVLLGLWRLLGRLPRPGAREVTLAWLLTVLLFVTVDLLLGLIVRHLYFMLPLACVAAATALTALAERLRWGRALAWACVGAYAFNGLTLWWLATVEYVKPSMAPLTH
jgi:hypothetical protein